MLFLPVGSMDVFIAGKYERIPFTKNISRFAALAKGKSATVAALSASSGAMWAAACIVAG